MIETSSSKFENLKEEITKGYYELPKGITDSDKKQLSILMNENKGKIVE